MGVNPSYLSASAKGREEADHERWSKPGGGKDKIKDVKQAFATKVKAEQDYEIQKIPALWV